MLPAATPAASPGGPDAPGRAASSNRDEAALLALVVARERRAFEELYRIYLPRLSRFVERTVRQTHLVGEIVNDTMLVVWRRAGTFHGGSKVSTWVFAIAYRTALKSLSRGERFADEEPEEGSTQESWPERDLMQAQDRRIVEEALLLLTPPQRAVIELTYFQEYSCREVAEIVACPVDTVKTRLFYARRRLQTLLSARKGDLR